MSNRLTFSLASLVVILALGLVFVATPVMAATFATGSISDQVWIQGQPKINITFPKATAETDDGVLTVTLTVNGTEVTAGAVSTDGGPLEGLTYASTITDAVAATTGTDAKPAVPASATGSLKGDHAHDVVATRAVVVYTVSELSAARTTANTDQPDDIMITFTAQVDEAPELMFSVSASIADMDDLTVGDAIRTMALPKAEGGVAPLTYALAVAGGGDLPEGITFTADTRLLSGTPSAVTSRTALTYTVTDSNPGTAGTDMLTFTVVVKARPTGPAFDIAKVPDMAYTHKHMIMEYMLPEANDTYAAEGDLTYKLTGLPKDTGLMFSAAMRKLTGTPNDKDLTASPIMAMYTVTDTADKTASVPFEITVNPVVTVTDIPDQSVTLGSNDTELTFSAITLGSTGGTGSKTFEVAGLPDGVSFDDKTKIMGTPSKAAAASTEVTVTATDTLGAMGTAKFKITVTKPKSLAFNQVGFTDAIAPRVFTVGQVIPPTALPSGMDGIPPYKYALDNLPEGLVFDENTRLLSGTPDEAQAAMDHTYTITDSAFSHIPVSDRNSNQVPTSITLPISITVKAVIDPDNNAPTFGDATIARLDARVNERISGRILPEATDADSDDTLTYSLEGSDGEDLPDGLMFDDETRSLTGTPTALMAETLYTYMVEDDDGDSDKISFFIAVNRGTPTPGVPTPVTTIPDKSYAVVVRDLKNLPDFGTHSPKLIEWDGMPNLHQLFIENSDRGGSLQLKVTDAAGMTLDARKVVFSEVMWAVDERKVGQASYDGNQWFEIYNRSGAAITESMITFTAQQGRPALAQETDLVSNVVGGGDPWIRTKGQNGDSGAADGSGMDEFISMYRNRYDREGWLGRDWTKSAQLYKPNHKGTPGMQEAAPAQTFAASDVRLQVVFNEIANYPSGQGSHEWIELRIKEGDHNFENWVVHMVTSDPDRDVTAADPTQVKLFQIPKLDTGRYDDILLITKTDPYRDNSHPLRGGYNVEVKPEDQDREGRDKNIRYYVADDWTTNLPDNGEFVLILRHGNDKTNHEKVEDLAGFAPNDAGKAGLRVNKPTFYSDLWPLIGYPAPNLSRNQLKSGAVYRRQKDDIAGTRTTDGNKKDHTAFRGAPDNDNGWTSVGYKRNADAGVQNGGTPGYPNNAKPASDTQASITPVMISEIMYATTDRGNVPQWIELRNTSKTVGVDLDGWQVTIVNHDQDTDGRFTGDLNKDYAISGKIPPGEVFLIVAYPGTDGTKLPSERVHSLRKRGEQILSQYGFEITLKTKEKDGNRISGDKAGNLAMVAAAAARVRNNPQSYEDPAWMLPMGENEDGDRVSIVRVSINGVLVADGQSEGAWKSFDMTAHVNARESTHYGNRNDLANPGYTLDGPLPVSMSKFRPERMKDTGAVVIRWVTESETNNAGFNILRGEKLDGEFTKINTKLIAGQGTTSERTAYTYPDTSAKPNVVYYYQIQDVSLDGQVQTLRTTHLRGNVTVAGKLTTTWGELKALQ